VSEAEITCEVRGSTGFVFLNRPKALNALTASMCDALFVQLQAWRADDRVGAVVIRGAGEKAFCAGGDVIRLYEDGRSGGTYPRDFYRAEYRCDTLIKNYPKPYVPVIDGIVMGGGVGVSVHGSYRIATDRTIFAMPETGIGLFPDVGGTYFLPRLPGALGLYLGLTGRRLTGADCVAIGLAEAFVKHDDVEALAQCLIDEAPRHLTDIRSIAEKFATPIEAAPITRERELIDRHFAAASIEDILRSLSKDTSAWARATRDGLLQKSPLSLKVTFRQMAEGPTLSFEDAMRLEWRLASRFAADHDFYEGVRALLVDKDMKPNWRPARLEDVTESQVEGYFAPLPDGELDLTGLTPGELA